VTSFLYNIDIEIVNKNQSKLDLQRVTIYVHGFPAADVGNFCGKKAMCLTNSQAL